MTCICWLFSLNIFYLTPPPIKTHKQAEDIDNKDNGIKKILCCNTWLFLFRIRIQAVNSIGVGPFSTPTKVTTRALPPSPPRLECLSVAPNSLKLKWGDGRNPDMVQYTLEMEKEDGRWTWGPNTCGYDHSLLIVSRLGKWLTNWINL